MSKYWFNTKENLIYNKLIPGSILCDKLKPAENQEYNLFKGSINESESQETKFVAHKLPLDDSAKKKYMEDKTNIIYYCEFKTEPPIEKSEKLVVGVEKKTVLESKLEPKKKSQPSEYNYEITEVKYFKDE